jgi:uncharacterized protein (DUF433 family)
MDWSECEIVEIIPGKVGGVPLIRGTRMPVEQVVDSLDVGETVDEIAYNHDLDPADILRLQAYRQTHQPAIPR